MKAKELKIINSLSIPLLVLMSFASVMGVFYEHTYVREIETFAVQGIGQDFVNLFVVLPISIISLIYLNRKSVIAYFIYSGTVFYYLYSYIIYTFGLHHTNLFLVYCFILALSVYTFILLMYFNRNFDFRSSFISKPPQKLVKSFLIFIISVFYLLWLKDIVPPMFINSAPGFVIQNGYAINAVHAIDLSFMLPGLILITILVSKKHNLGYLLLPVILIFTFLLTLAIIGMLIALQIADINEDLTVSIVFFILALSSVFLFVKFLKSIDLKKLNSQQ